MEHERILHILDYLTRFTNEKKEVTVRDIQAHLSAQYALHDVSALTIRRDIDRLNASGYDVSIRHGAHNTAYYSLTTNGFTFNEIRFLVDSVSINRFLTDKQKKTLIRKFEVLCSEEEVRQLVSRIMLNSRTAPQTDLLDNLEKVHRIIAEKRKIQFDYGKYDTNGQISYYHKTRNLMPCTVIYFNERFYLRCIDDETGNLRTYRVDRMKHITAGEKGKRKQILPKPEGAVLDMFDPEGYERVVLRVKRFLLDDLMEQFGAFADAHPDPQPDWVQVHVRVGICKSFFRWLMKYGADAELLQPESLRERMKQYLLETLAHYKTNTN